MKNPLSDIETAFIVSNYPKMKSIEIAKHLKRPNCTIYRKLKKLGLVTYETQQSLAAKGLRRCVGCKKELPIENFGEFTSKGKYQRRQNNCPSCASLNSIEVYNKRYFSLEEYAKRCLSTAARRRHPCSLIDADIINLFHLQGGKCFYSGRELLLVPKSSQTISIDRLNPKEGYHKDNIVLCCSAVNLMKQSMLYVDFLDWCQVIVSHPKA